MFSHDAAQPEARVLYCRHGRHAAAASDRSAASGASEIFQILRDGARAHQRATLAHARPASPARPSPRRVDELLRSGSCGPSPKPPRPADARPSQFAFNPLARIVLAVDLGATHATRRRRRPRRRQSSSSTPSAIDIADGPEAVLELDGRRPASALLEQLGLDRHELVGDRHRRARARSSTRPGRPTNPPIMPGWDRFDVPRLGAAAPRRAGARRQRREHPGPRRAGARLAAASSTSCSSRSRPASAPASSRAACCSAARRASPATSATCSVPCGARRRRATAATSGCLEALA